MESLSFLLDFITLRAGPWIILFVHVLFFFLDIQANLHVSRLISWNPEVIYNINL